MPQGDGGPWNGHSGCQLPASFIPQPGCGWLEAGPLAQDGLLRTKAARGPVSSGLFQKARAWLLISGARKMQERPGLSQEDSRLPQLFGGRGSEVGGREGLAPGYQHG